MAGKGSRPRPVNREIFNSNWDKIFGDKNRDLAYESDNPLERPIDPKNFKYVQQDMTELNADGNESRGRFGEDLNDRD